MPLFYYLRLSCFAIKGEFSELASKQKSFISVDIKHFKTEGKMSSIWVDIFGEISNVLQFGRKPNIRILKSFPKPSRHCLQLLCCYSGLHSPSQNELSNYNYFLSLRDLILVMPLIFLVSETGHLPSLYFTFLIYRQGINATDLLFYMF